MKEMQSTEWRRSGSSIVWAPELLERLIIDGDAIALREALHWMMHGFPDDRRATTGRSLWVVWRVEVHGGKGQFHRRILTIGLNEAGERSRQLEQLAGSVMRLEPAHSTLLGRDGRAELQIRFEQRIWAR